MFGARAGKAAARFASDQSDPTGGVPAQVADEKRRLNTEFLEKTGGTERVAGLRTEMQQALESGAGIYSQGSALQAAANKVQELKERFRDVSLDDRSRTFNTELVACLELSNMLDLADAIIQSGLYRTESRGAHQRTDHPARDDEKFLAHSLAYRTEDGPSKIEYLPVTITRWAPGERVYGR